MKWLVILLVSLFVILQYKLWLEDDGIPQVIYLKQEIAEQQQQNEQLKQRNQILAAEVTDLKTGDQAVAQRAREELGMVKQGEQFYQVVK